MNAAWGDLLSNPELVPLHVRDEIGDAAHRAAAAGARLPLEFMGVGMYGIVFCGREGHAWKVFRMGPEGPSRFIFDVLTGEFEWLRDAAETPISGNVAKVFAVHPDEVVLERECVPGTPGGWADERSLWDLHVSIEKAMVPVGWSAPEFKGSSYIIREDGTPVLVDISMAQRLGMNIAGYVEDRLAARREGHETWHDLAFFVLREIREKAIPKEYGMDLVRRLNERDPSIKEGFSLEGRGRPRPRQAGFRA